MNATVSKVLGDLVKQSTSNKEGVWYQLRQSHSKDLKSALRNYVAANNKVYRTRFQVHFPKPFVLRISELEERSHPRSARGSAAPGAEGPGR